MLQQNLILLGCVLAPLTSAIAQPDLLFPTMSINAPYAVVYQFSQQGTIEYMSYDSGLILATNYQRPLGSLGFDKGTCTDYASSKRPELFRKNGKRLITGNAKDRLWKAKKIGISTSTVPKKGSIAVYAPGTDDASEYGHVAYVEEVGSNGVIVVSDMNYKGTYIVTRRTISADVAVGYID